LAGKVSVISGRNSFAADELEADDFAIYLKEVDRAGEPFQHSFCLPYDVDGQYVVLLFKALKLFCKVKTLVGASANTLKTQIWIALILMLLVKILRMRSSFGQHLSNFMVLLRQQLFVYRDLWKWINDPFQAPETPPTPQLELALA
jgi:hypothetical protein